MKIEVLYSEVANLYGDLFNIHYLEKTIPNLTVYYTSLNDKPKFVEHKIDLIYMGPMMERFQEVIINKLKPYKKRIKELIENDTIFLITGNALEIFGSKIDDIKALGIFQYYSKRDFSYHHNSCFIGKFNDMKIVGFKSQFSYTYNNKNNFIKVINGYGMNEQDNNEGIRYHNFIATYLIGPFLIYNPPFTEYLLKLLKYDGNIAIKEAVYEAYNIRKEEYLADNLIFKHWLNSWCF